MGEWREIGDSDDILILRINGKYRAIKSDGTEVVGKGYDRILVSDDNQLLTLYERGNGYSVIDRDGKTIVPFGVYAFIDGFDKGLSRVKKLFPKQEQPPEDKNESGLRLMEGKWGLINSEGEEILPAVFEEIWKFYGQNRTTTRMKYDGHYWQIKLNHGELSQLAESIRNFKPDDEDYDYEGDYPDDTLFNVTYYSPNMIIEDDELEDAIESGEYIPEDW